MTEPSRDLLSRVRWFSQATRAEVARDPLAWTRWLWWRLVRRYAYEVCRKCGRPVGAVWRASDELWVGIMGTKGNVRCIPCFDRACLDRGITLDWHAEMLTDQGGEGG